MSTESTSVDASLVIDALRHQQAETAFQLAVATARVAQLERETADLRAELAAAAATEAPQADGV